MNEIDVLRHAKGYIDKLSEGVDPLTDNELPESDIVNNERISKCLSYVSGVLGKVIANGGEIGKRGFLVKKPFSIDQESLSAYAVEERPLTVSEVAGKINELINDEETDRLKASAINNYLMKCGMLYESESISGKKSKRPTDAGRSIGVFTEQRMSHEGIPYTAVIFTAEAQRFVLDNIEGIIKESSAKYNSLENQNKPWTDEEDNYLTELFQNGTNSKEAALILKRRTSSITSRLKKLGLIEKKKRPEEDV